MLVKMLGKVMLDSAPPTSNLLLTFKRTTLRQLMLRLPSQPMGCRMLIDTLRESKDSLKNCMKTCKSGLFHVPKHLLVLQVGRQLETVDMSICWKPYFLPPSDNKQQNRPIARHQFLHIMKMLRSGT